MVRIRQHVNPLKSSYRERRAAAIELPADPRVEVEVEIGCAEAWFLFDRAAQDLERVEIGLEIRQELIAPVNERARAEGVNVRAVFAHVNVDLPSLFPPGRIARLFVNFPDPWFKKKHHKRRLVDDELIPALRRVLRPGGELFFQSDVFDLALDAMATIEDRPDLFRNEAGPWSFWKEGNPYGARSRRDVQCRHEGVPIWRILYRAV